MIKEKLQNEIVAMLPHSGISSHQKKMIGILIYTFDEPELQNIYDALRTEAKKLRELERKEKRVVLKYEMAMDKLTSTSK